MELKRKIYDKLVEWKNGKRKSAVLIEGARRVGKSTIAKKFARENYRSYVVIDFAKARKSVKDNFLNNLDDLDLFFQNISLEYGVPIFPHETLIVFDEVQRFPRAREAIKYLVEDGRCDFIETGSLISIKENVEGILIPSEELKLKMYPLDFEEFLWAAKDEVLSSYIQECAAGKKPLEEAYHKKAMRRFKEYMLVGGMPQSVVAYFENAGSFFEADKEKRLILSLYRDDISKANRRYGTKVASLFENIPSYLSRHEKKVTLSLIQEGATFKRFVDPFFWLEDSMICNDCYKCNDPSVGLSLNKNDSQVKCYMGDTGLLVSLAFSENELLSEGIYRDIMNDKLSLNEGMIYENAIAQMIASTGRKLYFYNHFSAEAKRNDIEIDFLVSGESKTHAKVYPIEVKSSKNYTCCSFARFKEKFKRKIAPGYIVHPKGYSSSDGVYKVPPYMFFFLLKEGFGQ